MSVDLKSVLGSPVLNGWGLFGLCCTPIFALIIYTALQTDFSSGAGVSAMIGYSVRWAIPFIYLAIAASSFQILFPGPFGSWWLRNRKYIGMCFAAAMAWQGLFIFMMSTFYRDYYASEVYFFRDELEGSIGYIFLAAMVITSFRFGRNRVNARQWKWIQKTGLYFLWAYPFSVYWWNLNYYGDPGVLDYLLYWSGFLAFALRIAAWGKKRHLAAARAGAEAGASLMNRLLGAGMVATGLVASATGSQWQKSVSAFLTQPEWSAELELWLPYWPLEPFLPLLTMGLGVLLFTSRPQITPVTTPSPTAASATTSG